MTESVPKTKKSDQTPFAALKKESKEEKSRGWRKRSTWKRLRHWLGLSRSSDYSACNGIMDCFLPHRRAQGLQMFLLHMMKPSSPKEEFSHLVFGIRPPLAGVNIPRTGKRGLGSRKSIIQARETNPNLNFRARIFSGGVGVFHMKGWGPKSSVCPSNPGKSNFFGGISRDFAGDIPQVPEKFEKKKFGFNFRSLIMCKWMRPFWGTDCRRAPKSLTSAQAAAARLCSAGIERARKCLQG